MSLKVDIRKKFKGFKLDVCFETKNEYLGLLGASGCGKSMTLKCIAGVETPDEGYIELSNRVLFDSSKKINLKPQDRNIGFLFQNYALFPNMTVKENIGIGLKLPKAEKHDAVGEMISTFHLQGMENKYPSQISGGQQQRVALARSIVYNPDILLLDEPFSALDSHLKSQVQAEILELLKSYKGEVVMVSHSMEEIYKFCKNIAIVEEGKISLIGDTKETFKNPRLVSVAKLTGCKNISACSLTGPNKIYSHDWDIEIELDKATINADFIGLQSTGFEIADTIDKDVIECMIVDIIERIQGYTIIFQNKNSRHAAANMYFDIKKEQWSNRINKNDLFLKINKDSVLLLK